MTLWSRDRRNLHLSLHVHDHSGVVLEVDEDALLLVPSLPLTDHPHRHRLLPEIRIALLHETHTHDVKPRCCDFVQATSDALQGHDGKVLVVRAIRTFMTLTPTLVLNLASSWSLSWTSSCPSPCLQLALLPVGGSCWCCFGLLFVLDCPDLCPLHVLTHVFTARSLACCGMTSPAKRCTTRLARLRLARLRLAELPHALSRVVRGLGDPSPTLRKTPPSRHCVEVSDPELGCPPCRWHGRRRAMCGPLLRRRMPRRWSLCLEGLYANGVLHLSLGFALLGLPRSCTRLLWIVVLLSSSESGDQSLHGYDRPAAVPAASCFDLAVSTSASGARSRRSSARVVSALASVRDTHSRSCALRPCVPRGQWVPSTSSTTSGRCS